MTFIPGVQNAANGDGDRMVLAPFPRRIRLSDKLTATPASVISVSRAEAPDLPPQGYRANIRDNSVSVEARDAAGEFYAARTLDQIASQCSGYLPEGEIEDWPDFPVRGVMLDISRDKVPTMDTLFRLVDELASWKINRLELYTEHTFAYRNHETVWRDASPMTGEEIRELDKYCRERHVELAPNQNSFGHFERWLKHPAYRDLAECPDGFTYPWGSESKTGSTLNPGDPRSIELVAELFGELLPNFTSRNFNVGCDETWELGQGRSKADCDARGKGRVYLEFLLKIHEKAAKHGKTMHFWGDIILQHPELIPELPKNAVALAWGYEAKHPFADQAARFSASGIPFFVCPGTSSWRSIAGRTDNCLANILNAAENGLKNGAGGFLNTDWGDCGHWQYLPVSYLGFVAGAGLSWCVDQNRILATDRNIICQVLNKLVFRDRSGTMGAAAYDLGNAYAKAGSTEGNSSLLFNVLNTQTLGQCPGYNRNLSAWMLVSAREFVQEKAALLRNTRMLRDDAGVIRAEFANAAAMLVHACNRALLALGEKYPPDKSVMTEDLRRIMDEHRRLWLARNRPGGLKDSLSIFETRMKEYEVQ